MIHKSSKFYLNVNNWQEGFTLLNMFTIILIDFVNPLSIALLNHLKQLNPQKWGF